MFDINQYIEKSLLPMDLIRVVFRYKVSIIVAALTFFIVAYLLLFKLLSPSWNVEATVMLESNFITQPLVDAPPPSDFEKTVEFHTQKDILTSKSLLSQVVEELGLGETRVIGNVENMRIWISSRKRWLGRLLGIKKWDVPFDYTSAATKALINNLGVEAQPDSKLIGLSYSAKSGPEAQQTLQKLLELFSQQYHQRVVDQASGVLQYIEHQIVNVKTDLEQSENQLLELKKSHNNSADGAFSVFDSTELRDEIKAYLLQLEETQRQTRLIRDKRQREAGLIELDKKIVKYTSMINSLPKAQLGELRIRRQIQAHQEFLNLLSRNHAKAKTVATGDANIIRLAQVVDAPFAQENPNFPKTGLMLILSLILAGMFGVFVGFFRYMNENAIYSKDELFRATGLDLLGSVE